MQWHGVKLNAPDWGEASHTLAATVRALGGRLWLHAILNAYWEPLEFEVPPIGAGHEPWRRCLDTFQDSPDDICAWGRAPTVQGPAYLVAAAFGGDPDFESKRR